LGKIIFFPLNLFVNREYRTNSYIINHNYTYYNNLKFVKDIQILNKILLIVQKKTSLKELLLSKIEAFKLNILNASIRSVYDVNVLYRKLKLIIYIQNGHSKSIRLLI